MNYDYIVVGSGLFGSIFAYEAKQRGHKVLVLEKRNHVAGNIYTEEQHGIQIHKYGAHIFHTSNEDVWSYVNQFATFNNYVNSPLAYYKGKIFNLPFNMNTFNQLWGVVTPLAAVEMIEKQKIKLKGREPANLEEQALQLVGKDIYETLIKGYTEKQWGKLCKDLPASIIRRIPVRYTYNNNYFNDPYQGIPVGGYTKMIEKMLAGIEVKLNVDYLEHKDIYDQMAKKIIYSGTIDSFYEYQYGPLEYRSLRFEHETFDSQNIQGNAVINYTDGDVAYTRIIEHKHFEFVKDNEKTIVTKEYPEQWSKGKEPYYPINDDLNQKLYQKYKALADQQTKVLFCGRLGEYKYYDMQHIVESVLSLVKKEFNKSI